MLRRGYAILNFNPLAKVFVVVEVICPVCMVACLVIESNNFQVQGAQWLHRWKSEREASQKIRLLPIYCYVCVRV